MNEPLFGEKKQETQVVVYVAAAILSVFVLYSVIIAIVFGIRDPPHFISAIALICTYVVLAVMCKWYTAGDLDPKFKFLIAFALVTVIIVAITVNVYVFKWPKPAPPPKIPCDGLYRVSDGACFSECYSGTCLEIFSSTNYTCSFACNSTNLLPHFR